MVATLADFYTQWLFLYTAPHSNKFKVQISEITKTVLIEVNSKLVLTFLNPVWVEDMPSRA